MLLPRRVSLPRLLRLAAILALLLFFSSLWLPHKEVCGSAWQPCLNFYHQMPELPLVTEEGAWPAEATPLAPLCPGQSFQAGLLLWYLKSSLAEEDDVLLGPYLQSWDQLINFMESLGAMVGFFSQKVKQKVALIRELSLKHEAEAHGKRSLPGSSGLQLRGAYLSLRSLAGAELPAGERSGCRTLLRLHRSLQWLQLTLQGLTNEEEKHKTPGEISREAYRVALAPFHPWVIRQAAELVFLALPERTFFLRLLCVEAEEEATPTMRRLVHALTLLHARTQRILEEYDMLELP